MTETLSHLLDEEERLLTAINEARAVGNFPYAVELGEALDILWTRIEAARR